MAVAVEMNFPGATLAQYDEVMVTMGLTAGGATPPGAISHWVASTDDGLRVVDVWNRATCSTGLPPSRLARRR